MARRIEVYPKVPDTRAIVKLNKIKKLGFDVENIQIIDVYTVDKGLSKLQIKKVGENLANPVTQMIGGKVASFNWALEIGFLPGVTDNIGHTAKEIIEDLLKIKFVSGESVYSSQLLLISGKLSEKKIDRLALNLINPLIQRVHVKSEIQFKEAGGMDEIVPKVVLNKEGGVLEVDLNVSDDELVRIGKEGIKNSDGARRGPLALEYLYMKEIQKYFKKMGRNPTDVELETLAQTWSEHCKHTIFADPIDEIEEGLYRAHIKAATEEIRRKKGKKDFCVSVFTDNSGAIDFNDKYLITHKVETHNSPAALDPFGGAITGIVGVNRDALGFGLSAKPIINTYGFMFGNPDDTKTLFRSPNLKDKMLSTRRIMDGVIEGVNAGGNQSGIPTPQGFIYFDDRYKGKPMVFCGTVGLIPKKINGRRGHVKKAKRGDLIVIIGGRVGLDGIHGATFASEELSLGSPASAVQIGDPITQKKLSDCLIREARGLSLYNSITDCGGGGLSSSVGEMAKESGGFRVYLDKIPLKYPGLNPWQIWISESQERMTLAVPKNKFKKLKELMESRGVEATNIGEFTSSGKCEILHNGKKVLDLTLEFTHNGLPKKKQKSSFKKSKNKDPKIPVTSDLSKDLLNLLSRKNIASFEFISTQYDHDVQGGSVLKPLVGAGRVNGEASVTRPTLYSQKGLVLSQGYYPSYGDIDPYRMAASSIDTAVRNLIAVGANPDKIALLDNFCWCSSNEPRRLGELRRATKACYDVATQYGTPFISGKDSMFNDFKGYDGKGLPLKISIPPTLLISSLGIIDDIEKTVSLDLKTPGDLVYVLGETLDELGGSEYFLYLSGDDPAGSGNKAPKIEAKKNWKLYKKLSLAIEDGLVSSSIAVNRGGLAVALSKMAMAGKKGIDVSLTKEFDLFSESAGRFVITINPKNQKKFEKLMNGSVIKIVGKVSNSGKISIQTRSKKISVNIYQALNYYRKTFKDY